MSKEATSNGMLGEISTIRNILMGEQMNQYEQRFQQMKEELETAREDLKKNLTQTTDDTNAHLRKIEQDVNAKLDKLEKLLTEGLDKMNQRIDQISNADKHQLGQMLAEMGNQLMQKE